MSEHDLEPDLPAPNRTAILVVDLQNDFLDPDGAYTRGGAICAGMTDLPGRVAPLLDLARTLGVAVVFSQFTLWPGREGAPLVSEHLHRLRPFIGPGDFAPGSWGQRTVDELGQADAVVEKVAYSAFAHTRLDWWLRSVGVHHLVVCGIVTNGGVASTVHDAHVRGYATTVLTDGCCAFDAEVHEATLTSLASVASVRTVAQMISGWSAS